MEQIIGAYTPETLLSDNSNGTITIDTISNLLDVMKPTNTLNTLIGSVDEFNDYVSIFDASTGAHVKTSLQNIVKDEIVLNNGVLTGVVPSGKELGVDTSTGRYYYKNTAGQWQAQPAGQIVSVLQNADGTATVNAGLGGTAKSIRPINEQVAATTLLPTSKLTYLETTGNHVSTTAQAIANLNTTGWRLTGNTGTNPTVNFIGTTDAQPLIFKTNNSERIRVDTAGNVGIGTTTLTEKLQVAGGNVGIDYGQSVVINQAMNNRTIISNFWNGSNDVLALNGAGNGNTVIIFGTALQSNVSTEKMRILSNGNVGIGTTAPATKLAVIDSNAAITVGNAGGSEGALFFGNPNHGVRRNYASITNDVGLYTTAADVHISANGESSKHITVKNNGNVGINNTNAQNKLHVTGGLANTTGIRTSITSASPATTETSYLAVNAAGDIVRGAAAAAAATANETVWSGLSATLNFGAKNGAGVREYDVRVTGTNQIQIRKNYGTGGVKTYQDFKTNAAALVVSSKDVTFTNNTAFFDISFDASGNAKTLDNNTKWMCTFVPFGGNSYRLEATNFGGGIMLNAHLLT